MSAMPTPEWLAGALAILAANAGLTSQARAQDYDGAMIEGQLDQHSMEYGSAAIKFDAGKRYAIGVDENDFDPKIALLAPHGEVVAEDDDGGEGNSALLDFSPDIGGGYRVRVTAVGEDPRVGYYRLHVRELPALPRPRRAKPTRKTSISLDAYAGTLGFGNSEIMDCYADDYAFRLEGCRTILTFLDSREIDPFLQVFTL